VIQIVSTGEALMERRLAEIPQRNGATSRSTLRRGNMCWTIWHTASRPSSTNRLPTSEGNCRRVRSYRDGQPVQSREAVSRRDRLIEKLAP